MTWLILILFSQFTWALGTFLDRYLVERFEIEEGEGDGVGILVLFSCIFQPVVLLTIFALSFILPALELTNKVNLFSMSTANMLIAMSIGVLEIIWLFPYLYALKEADETQVAPLFQAEAIFGLLFGIFIFSEVPEPHHILAGTIIILGALILNLDQSLEENGDLSRIKLNWGVLGKMLFATGIIAFIAFVFKYTALEEGNFWGTAFWMSVGALITSIIIWVFSPSYRNEFNNFIGKRDWKGIWLNIINEIADNTAILAFYGAVVLGPSTALVQSMKAYQPIFVLLIAFIVTKLGSTFHRAQVKNKWLVLQKIVGVTIIVGGSLLIF